MMRFQHADTAATVVLSAEAFHSELWPRFLLSAIAHVNDGHIITLSRRNATAASHGVMSAAAVPLPGVDLKVPGEAPVQHKRAGLVVVIVPVRSCERKLVNMSFDDVFSVLQIPAIQRNDMWVCQ